LSLLSTVSKAIMDLQGLYGLIPHRVGIGKKSAAVLTQLSLLESKYPSAHGEREGAEIGHLLLVDRDSDFPSCLLSPVTYEALLDEVFGIRLGVLDFEQAATEPKGEGLAKEKVDLAAREKLFDQIRYKHFSSIFGLITAHAQQIRQAQAKAQSMNVGEMKDFVQKNLRDLKLASRSVSIHIGASETITEEKGYIYEHHIPLELELTRGGSSASRAAVSHLESRALPQLYPSDVSLRLMCLASLCSSGGLSAAEYTRLKKSFCDAHGHRHLATFLKLERAGLLRCKGGVTSTSAGVNFSRPDFQQLSSKLGLIPHQRKQCQKG
jgi:hypothetical protein